MSDHNARERAASANATAPAKLPALPAVRVSDPGLQRWIEAAQQWFNTRAGATDPFERALTVRDLVQFGLVDGSVAYRGTQQRSITPPSTLQGANVLIQTPGGSYPLSIEAFAKAITDTGLFRSLMQRLDDPTRFDSFPDEIKALLSKSIADEAASRGAEVRRLEGRIQEESRSLAYSLEEVTASVEGSMAGVRETSFASATAARAMAGQVTQVQARLDGVPVDPAAVLATVHADLAALELAIPAGVQGKYYQVDDPASAENFLYRWDGADYVLAGHGNTTAGTATVEQSMLAVADRSTGLESRYSLKVQAGNKLAGFGLSATENDQGATSAFIIAADKFAIVDAADTIADPLNPPLARIPFGVDVANNTIYINGNVRINAGGPLLSGLTGTEKTVVVFAYKRSASAPGDNPGDGGVYDFDTKTLSGLANGWSASIPASNGNPLYVRAATASSSGTTDGILGTEWSGAVILAQDGAGGADGSDGAAGLNSATVQLFRRTATSTAPTLGGSSPTNDLTYTFATGAITGTPPAGWTASMPDPGDGAYLWTVRATAANTTATDEIPPTEFGAVEAVAQDGSDGATAQTLSLAATGFAFVFEDSSATTSASPTVTFTAKLQNVAGTADFLATAYNAAGSSLGTITLGGSGNTRTLSAALFVTYANTRYVTVSATLGALSDTATVYRGDEGSDAVQVALSNESHTIPTASDGTGGVYTGSGTTVRVFQGTTELTYDGVGTANGTWTVVATPTNITRGTLTDSGAFLTIGDHSAITADTASVSIAISGKTTTGAAFSFTRLQSLSRSKAGAVGRSVSCYTDIGTHAFTLNGNGTGVNESGGIQPRRTLAGFAGTGTTVWSLVSGTFTGATTTLSESDGRMANVTVDEMGTDAITLRCTYTEGSFTASDDITLYKLKDGVGAYLSNEAHTLPASSAGVVSSYTGATGTFVVLDGGRVVSTARLTFTVVAGGFTGFSGGGGLSINSAGVYTVSSGILDASDVATVTLRCVYAPVHGASVTMDRVFTITKAKQGAQGSTGGTGGTGPAGTRGTRQLYDQNAAYTSGYGAGNYATQATALIAAATSGSTPTTPIKGDTVTFTDGSTYTYTITHNGSSWQPPGVVIDGNLLVTGSITTTKLSATAIDGKTITGSTIRTAASGARCEINHSNNELSGYNSGGTKVFYVSMSTGLFYLAGAAPINELALFTNNGAGRALQVTNTSTGAALKATSGAGHAVEGGSSSSGAGVRGISNSGEGVYGTSTSGPGGRFSSLRIDQGSAAGSAQWLLPNGGSTASGKPGANSTGVFVPLNMNGAPGYILWWPA